MKSYCVLGDALSDLKDVHGMLEVLTYYTASADGSEDVEAIGRSVSAIKDLLGLKLDMLESAIVENNQTIRMLKEGGTAA